MAAGRIPHSIATTSVSGEASSTKKTTTLSAISDQFTYGRNGASNGSLSYKGMTMLREVHTTSSPGETIKRLLPWLVAVAFFMQSLDTTILNTAVPAIAQAMQVTPLDMKSVLASYTLSLAVFIPISGWMADRFGTRRVFGSAIALFTVSSLLC